MKRVGVEAPCPLERPPGREWGVWRDIDVHVHRHVHRYLATCLHNQEHDGSQCWGVLTRSRMGTRTGGSGADTPAPGSLLALDVIFTPAASASAAGSPAPGPASAWG